MSISKQLLFKDYIDMQEILEIKKTLGKKQKFKNLKKTLF